MVAHIVSEGTIHATYFSKFVTPLVYYINKNLWGAIILKKLIFFIFFRLLSFVTRKIYTGARYGVVLTCKDREDDQLATALFLITEEVNVESTISITIWA